MSLTLPLSLDTVSAATGNQAVATNISTNGSTSTVTKTNSTPDPNLASGSTSTTTASTTFTIAQVNDASSRVKSFAETNGRLPNYVTIANIQVTMPQFLKLVMNDLLLANAGSKSSITVGTVYNPANPSESFVSGNINKSEYVNVANTISTYINNYNTVPNFARTSLGTIRYESLIYIYSKIMVYYATYNRLPNYVSVKPGAVKPFASQVSADLQPYLQPGTNCQSTDPSIVALSASITSGLTSTYDKAAAIFNWVRDNIPYSFYYGTKYGAVGTLAAKTGNCVDHSHLVIALARAAGIPARYQYGYCNFTDGWYAHVWAQLYVNGNWYYADTISTNNTFGVINNWDLKTYKLYGTYAQW